MFVDLCAQEARALPAPSGPQVCPTLNGLCAAAPTAHVLEVRIMKPQRELLRELSGNGAGPAQQPAEAVWSQ